MTATKHDFSGTHAYVTGAGGGIGHAIVCHLVRAGARVVAFDIKPDPTDFPSGPGSVAYVQGDITDAGQLAASFSSFTETGLDFLVNAAGIFFWNDDGSVVDMDLDVWDRTMRINLVGAIHAARLAVPLMARKGSGSMVHVASIVGLRSVDNHLEAGPSDGYLTSKAALIAVSRSLALTYGRQGIRSNTVCPGSVWTPMTGGIYADPDRVEAMKKRTPLPMIGRPDDIAQACMFLLSDDASFVTATDLVVDGGLTAKLQ